MYFAHGYTMDGWSYGYSDSAWSWLFMLLMMSLLALGVVLVVRLIIDDHNSFRGDALEALKYQYTKGEITKSNSRK